MRTGTYAPSIMATAANLPADDLTSFAGRSGELAELPRLPGTARLVTVTGAGGVGKSRRALRAPPRVQDRLAHGVWRIDPSGLPEPARLEQTAADALATESEGTPYEAAVAWRGLRAVA